jgi:raffinose/stachyose/melibiose transport system permease protein
MTARPERMLNYAILTFFSLVALLPLVGIVLTALQPGGDLAPGVALPDRLSLDNFRHAWEDGGLGRALVNSTIITTATVVISTVCSVLTGYAFGTMRFRGRTVLFYLFIVGLVMPFEATVIPLYYDLRTLGLTGTYWAVILPVSALNIAFGTFWMRAFFLSSPRSVIEAARLDGASTFTILWKVLLPFGRPAVLTLVVLLALYTWNDFFLSLVMLSDPALQTAPVRLALFQTQRTQDVPGVAAAAVIVSLPILVVYVSLQRQFIRGMLAGAVKG